MKRLTIVAAALFATVAAGISYAAIPGAVGVISGCYQKNEGMLRVIDAATGSCRDSEEPLAWNQQGPKGDKGDEGDQGDQGETGPQGPAGPSGAELGAGVGLEKLVLQAPPPVGDQTVLQVQQGYRLPQQCAAGSVPQRSGVGAGWVCGAAGGQGLPPAYHASGGHVDLAAHGRYEMAALAVPAGSYVINALGRLQNGDIFGSQPGACELSTGGRSYATLPEAAEDEAEIPTNIPVLGVATFDEPSRIVLLCGTYDGWGTGELTAIRVAGIN
jgi:hypothetical protein